MTGAGFLYAEIPGVTQLDLVAARLVAVQLDVGQVRDLMRGGMQTPG